ncbi:MAG: VWA domain-containing protein [Pirellulales bacterium]|nr:VWA domain-containing protein [Pirellulales bacterium]
MITLSPWWWLLALLAVLPWVGPWRGTNRPQNILRSLLFVALAAALSRPHLVGNHAPVQRILIIDQSPSVDPDSLPRCRDGAVRFAQAHRSAQTHLIVLGPTGADQPSKWQKKFDTVTWLSQQTAEGSSPLSAALSHASMLIPNTGVGSIAIASDGLATRPDDARAIAALRSRNIPIDWIPLPADESMPRPVKADWRDELRVGVSGVVTATIVSHGPPNPGRVSLHQGDKVLASAPYDGASRATIDLEFEPEQAGFLSAELRVASQGQTRAEQVLPVVLPIQPPRQVVYLGGLQQDGARKLAMLLGPGFDITEIDPAAAADIETALSNCDLVILDDCFAESISPAVERQLVDAVTGQGLGLVMSGGRASFGAGGWHGRPIETLLPVELVQKEEKRDPSTTLVIVIDTSGSMSGVRVQLAKEVSRLAMRRLLPHDKVGIVEFYGAKRWAAPIQPASNAIELQRALNRMDAGGGTVILPALEEAFYGLQNVDTRYKHVLVLTDGGVESGDFESLMRRMANEGINVSTVLAGGGYHSEFLVNIANWGKGRFYNVPNRFSLPEILLKQPSTAKLPAYRPGVHQVRARGGQGWWGDLDTGSIPQLAGYVEGKARPGAEVLLETREHQHPVLATWRYGLGRVTTLGTEPVGPGTQPWRDWRDYGKTLARILERSAADARDPFRFHCLDDGGLVQVHAIRQRPDRSEGSGIIPQGTWLQAGD